VNRLVTRPLHLSVRGVATPDYSPPSYFIAAKIHEDHEEGFTALCYAGQICGTAFGYNKHGIALAGNALFPRNVIMNEIAVGQLKSKDCIIY